MNFPVTINWKTPIQATKRVCRDSKKPNDNSPSAVQVKEAEEKIPTAQNFEIVANKSARILCKLCSSDGHSIGKCETSSNYESKLARILELSLCSRRAGLGHKESECYGKKGKLRFQCLICKKREHPCVQTKIKLLRLVLK